MTRVFVALLTAVFVVGSAGSALAAHHEEGEKVDAHAQCAHAADEPCPHEQEADSGDKQLCTKHVAGEECTCSKHEKSDDGHAAHS